VTVAERRKTLVSKEALDVGQRWVEALREELKREGRPVEGGWPGTLSEARARVDGSISRLLAKHRLAVLSSEELSLAARAAYDHARRTWLALPERW
jgi:hypothetical protein